MRYHVCIRLRQQIENTAYYRAVKHVKKGRKGKKRRSPTFPIFVPPTPTVPIFSLASAATAADDGLSSSSAPSTSTTFVSPAMQIYKKARAEETTFQELIQLNGQLKDPLDLCDLELYQTLVNMSSEAIYVATIDSSLDLLRGPTSVLPAEFVDVIDQVPGVIRKAWKPRVDTLIESGLVSVPASTDEVELPYGVWKSLPGFSELVEPKFEAWLTSTNYVKTKVKVNKKARKNDGDGAFGARQLSHSAAQSAVRERLMLKFSRRSNSFSYYPGNPAMLATSMPRFEYRIPQSLQRPQHLLRVLLMNHVQLWLDLWRAVRSILVGWTDVFGCGFVNDMMKTAVPSGPFLSSGKDTVMIILAEAARLGMAKVKELATGEPSVIP